MKIIGRINGEKIAVESDDPGQLLNMWMTLLKAMEETSDPLDVDAVDRRVGFTSPVDHE